MISGIRNNLGLKEKEAIADIFTEKYYTAYFNGITCLSYLILQLFKEMRILRILKDKYCSCDEIITEFNFIPKAKFALEWMLSFLNQNGFLRRSGSNGTKRYFYDQGGNPALENVDLQNLIQKITGLDKKNIPVRNLVEYVLSEYPDFFYGRKKGFEILLAQDKMKLWNDYFSNEDSNYGAYNFLGTIGVLRWSLGQENIRLLEVGGGTGSATSSLIGALKDNKMLFKISEYIFSDISPVFLRIGNKAIMSRVGDDFQYSLKRIDFDKPLIEQGISENGIDVVYGVNTLHVAKNLVSALKNIYQVLKPGGKVVLSECCRPDENYLLFQEIIFNLLENYVNVDLDNYLRPVPGFLDYEHWRRNLEASGFRNIEAVFNTDGSYPHDLKTKVDIVAAVIKGKK